MAVSHPVREDTAAACSHEEGAQRNQRCDDREPSPASDTEAEENDVPGHVRREHVAESEVADGVDDAGGEGQHQQRPGQWMLDAAGGAPQRFRVEPRLGGAGRLTHALPPTCFVARAPNTCLLSRPNDRQAIKIVVQP